MALGLGVADAIDSYLDRKLGWLEDEVTECDGSRVVVSVPRYPVAVFSSVELQTTPGAVWEDLSGSVMRYVQGAGLISFRHPPANEFGTIRVTSTGGFWWDESEEADGTLPEGATPLPPALFTAWAMQVQAHCNALDLFGAQSGKDTLGASSNLLTNADAFIPAVEATLKRFRRFAA